MRYSVVLLLASLLTVRSRQGIASQSLSPLAAGEPCEQSMATSEQVIVGLYPLQVTVTNIDYENGAIDFATEVGTSLHVIDASTSELKRLKVGDTVEMCIAEELYGDWQT